MAGKFFVRLTIAYNERSKRLDFYPYYKKIKLRKEAVRQRPSDEELRKTVRYDLEVFEYVMSKVKEINELDENMQTDFSKTVNNLLFEKMMDEKSEQQKFEISDI